MYKLFTGNVHMEFGSRTGKIIQRDSCILLQIAHIVIIIIIIIFVGLNVTLDAILSIIQRDERIHGSLYRRR